MQLLTVLSLALSNALMVSAQTKCTTWFYSDDSCKTLLEAVDTPCDYLSGPSCPSVNQTSQIKSVKTDFPLDNGELLLYSKPGCEGDAKEQLTNDCTPLESGETVASLGVQNF
ncbi:hypothetical protein PISL3812_00215 [Talaromyces islandicus]|uniref:Uncharacterized protein n=1 Tax=Talaromyces islandicus TaxID=28573 RepID=A0A0U1LIN7_TALIS|nr:hypothetical protein PISL3812_00215 [Talaromyces islandicus]